MHVSNSLALSLPVSHKVSGKSNLVGSCSCTLLSSDQADILYGTEANEVQSPESTSRWYFMISRDITAVLLIVKI